MPAKSAAGLDRASSGAVIEVPGYFAGGKILVDGASGLRGWKNETELCWKPNFACGFREGASGKGTGTSRAKGHRLVASRIRAGGWRAMEAAGFRSLRAELRPPLLIFAAAAKTADGKPSNISVPTMYQLPKRFFRHSVVMSVSHLKLSFLSAVAHKTSNGQTKSGKDRGAD